MDVQAVGEGESRTFLHVRREVVAVQVGLKLVRGQQHDHVGDLGRIGRGHHGEAGGRRLGAARAVGPGADDHVLYAAVAQIVGMGMALTAIADDADFLALDQVDVGITIVIDAHGGISSVFRFRQLYAGVGGWG